MSKIIFHIGNLYKNFILTNFFVSSNFSPQYLSQDDLDPATIVMTEAEDIAKREIDQTRARKGSRVDNVMNAEEKALERKAKEGMGLNDEEATFAGKLSIFAFPNTF